MFNSSFRLGSERSDARFRVAAICSALPGFRNFGPRGSGGGIGPADVAGEFYHHDPDGSGGGFPVDLPGVGFRQRLSQKEVARKIREEFDVRYRFGVSSTAEQKQEARVLYWATQVLFGALLAVAVVIAVFALIASMASTVLERRREIGVLKSLGLRRYQLFRLFLGEAVI